MIFGAIAGAIHGYRKQKPSKAMLNALKSFGQQLTPLLLRWRKVNTAFHSR
jgi:hypothetical protein